jgi:phage portal protein BeeE
MFERIRNSVARGFEFVAQRVSTETRYIDKNRVPTTIKTIAGVAITPDTAVTIAAVWACLRYLSQTVAVLPWHVMKDGDKGAEIQDRNPLDYLIYRDGQIQNGRLSSFARRWFTGLCAGAMATRKSSGILPAARLPCGPSIPIG